VDGADVVAATTNGAAAFDRDAFDVAVVDEATQASRAATAIAHACAEKLVLAGDHRQLPPYSVTEAGEGRCGRRCSRPWSSATATGWPFSSAASTGCTRP